MPRLKRENLAWALKSTSDFSPLPPAPATGVWPGRYSARPVASSASWPSPVWVSRKSALMKPPILTVVPGAAPGVMVVTWIGCLPAGTVATAGCCACTAFTAVTSVWAWLIWPCCCWVVDSSSCTWRSSSATRASSCFSLAVSANAMPGATSATSKQVASGLRMVFNIRVLMLPSLPGGKVIAACGVTVEPSVRPADAPRLLAIGSRYGHIPGSVRPRSNRADTARPGGCGTLSGNNRGLCCDRTTQS